MSTEQQPGERRNAASPLRIQSWSGPRNISTAFMYSWAQRADTTVVDEPLYAAYLDRHDRGHPMTAEVLAAQSSDPADVVRSVVFGDCATPVLFLKQMAHHLRGLDAELVAELLGGTENILLTRAPADMLASLSVQLPHCELDDTGLPEQVELLESILDAGGAPVVVDSAVLLADPTAVLTELCRRLGIAFDAAMLSWEPGPKPYDGVWAPAWYDNVHRTSGFGASRSHDRGLEGRLLDVLAEAQPLYDRLAQFLIEPES